MSGEQEKINKPKFKPGSIPGLAETTFAVYKFFTNGRREAEKAEIRSRKQLGIYVDHSLTEGGNIHHTNVNVSQPRRRYNYSDDDSIRPDLTWTGLAWHPDTDKTGHSWSAGSSEEALELAVKRLPRSLWGDARVSAGMGVNMAVAIDKYNRDIGGDLADNTYGALGYAIVGLFEKYGERPVRWAFTARNGQIMDTFPEKRRSDSQLKSSAIAISSGALHYRYELDTSADESERLVKSGTCSPVLWSGSITNGISAASENSMQSLSAILDSNGNYAIARNTYAENALGRAAVELHSRFNSMPYAWVAMDGLRVRHT